jgi:uroporphyrin-III C-methyltransferase/precorrin-2 dehydrogenase/sirohydrochlorin ferrochelatase
VGTGFRKTSCSSKKLKRDGDSKKSHHGFEPAMTLSAVPVDPPPARMAPLARLPLFFKLDGRRAVVAGASPAAAWKAELLAAAGARVDVYAPEPCAALQAVAAAVGGAIAIHRRAWKPEDCAGAALAVGDCRDDAEAARFAAAARAAGVPVNVVDRPAFGDFAFGAIVNRSPLVIGVSTDGAAPVFAQAIRARIETLLPQGFARWAEAAARWRPRVRGLTREPEHDAEKWIPVFGTTSCSNNNPKRDGDSKKSHPALVARFWEKFVARAIAQAHTHPDETDLAAALAQAEGARTAGAVVLVAAGRDPEMLTLRAVRALRSADVILFDRQIGAGVLDFARREARRLLVDPSGGDEAGTSKQNEIEAMLIALATAGRRVVRLCDHETCVESEIAACRAAGVAVEVVPGVIPPPQGEGGERSEPGGGRAAVRE